MFQGVKNLLRRVGEKLGLIAELKKVNEVNKIAMTDEFYLEVVKWRSMHRGYFKDMHDYTYYTPKGKVKGVRTTLNMPKVVSQELATMIFNERCQISVSDKGFNDYIQGIFKDNRFNSEFQQQLEFGLAYGGLVIKPYIENNKIRFAYVTALGFFPVSWHNGKVREAVFASDVVKNGKEYTHLEWHLFEDDIYLVKNELYERDTNMIGKKASLKIAFPDLEEEVRLTGVKQPLFAYFKPNIANNIDPGNPLGISIYANSYDVLKTIDIIYDSLQREYRLGKKRIFIPQSAVSVKYDVNGKPLTYFDENDETYVQIQGDDMQIHETNTTIRIQEHIEGINANLNLLSMQIGLSEGSLSFDGKSIKTATEVVSENSKTFRTKKAHENVLEQTITDLIEVIRVLSELFDLYNGPEQYDVTAYFDDSIINDKVSDINREILLLNNRMQSEVDALMNIFGLTREEAEEKRRRIKLEQLSGSEEYDALMNNVINFGPIE